MHGRADREVVDFLPLAVEVSTDGEHFMGIARTQEIFTAYVGSPRGWGEGGRALPDAR